MPRFVVWGRIAGEPVPEMKVGSVSITSTVPSKFETLKDQGGVTDLRSTVANVPSYATSSKVDIAVESSHYFWITLDASDGIKAGKVAISEHLTPLIAGLLASTGEPYYAQAVWASELDNRGQVVQSIGVPIESTTACHFDTRPPLDADSIVSTVLALHSDQRARQAGEYLVEGLRMNFRATTDSERGAAVLRMHLCTETLARTVYRKQADTESEVRQERIVSGLRETLSRVGTTSQATKAIQNARQDLEREQLRFLRDQIERLGADLNLAPETVKDAVKVAKFRNQVLGHTSSKAPSRDEWREWSERARRSAAAFLYAFCHQPRAEDAGSRST